MIKSVILLLLIILPLHAAPLVIAHRGASAFAPEAVAELPTTVAS